MKHLYLASSICFLAGFASAKVSWHKELSDARQLALGRILNNPSPDPSPSAAASGSPSPSMSPSRSVSPSSSPSPSHTAHSATKTATLSPAASLSNAVSPSPSALAVVSITIVQSVSIFSVDQLEEHPEVVQSLLGAFKEFVSVSTDDVQDVHVVALVDGLTQKSTSVPLNSIFNQLLLDRRLTIVPEGGAGIQYSLTVPPVTVAGDTNGVMTQAAQIEAATQARVQMLLNDDQGGFRAIMVPVIEQQATILGVNSSNLVTLLGWQDSTIEVPVNPRAPKATSKHYPTAAIIGVIAGVMGGAVITGCLLWAAGFCGRRKEERAPPTTVVTWGGGAAEAPGVADHEDVILADGVPEPVAPAAITYITVGGTVHTTQVLDLHAVEPVSILTARV